MRLSALVLFAALALAVSPRVVAAEPARSAVTAIGVHLWTHHVDGRAGCLRHADGWGWYVYPCRDRTPGLYVRLADRWIVGGYENSIGRTSVYAGRTWTMVEVLDGRVALDVALGAVTGYDRASVEPMVAASVRVALGERVALRLLPIPRIPRRTETAAVHVAVEVRL